MGAHSRGDACPRFCQPTRYTLPPPLAQAKAACTDAVKMITPARLTRLDLPSRTSIGACLRPPDKPSLMILCDPHCVARSAARRSTPSPAACASSWWEAPSS